MFADIQRNALNDFEPESIRAHAAQLAAAPSRCREKRFQRFNDGAVTQRSGQRGRIDLFLKRLQPPGMTEKKLSQAIAMRAMTMVGQNCQR